MTTGYQDEVLDSKGSLVVEQIASGVGGFSLTGDALEEFPATGRGLWVVGHFQLDDCMIQLYSCEPSKESYLIYTCRTSFLQKRKKSVSYIQHQCSKQTIAQLVR